MGYTAKSSTYEAVSHQEIAREESILGAFPPTVASRPILENFAVGVESQESAEWV